MFGFVYVVKNEINGKKYIGKHEGDPSTDDGYRGSGILVKRAHAKYGKRNFTREVIEVCETEEKLIEAEEKWIRHFDAVNSDDFYNLTESSVGKRRSPMKETTKEKLRGRKLSDETKRRMSEAKRGIQRDEETRMKISKAKKGVSMSEEAKENMRGHRGPHSEEHKAKIKKAAQLRPKKEYKLVDPSGNERVFEGRKQVEEQTGLNKNQIGALISGAAASIKGWRHIIH